MFDRPVADPISRELEHQEEAEASDKAFLATDALLRKVYSTGGGKNILSYKQFCIVFLTNLGIDDEKIAERLRMSLVAVRVRRCQAKKKLRVFASS